MDGCTDMGVYPGLMPGSPSAQPDKEGALSAPTSLLHSPFLLDFLCHPSDERREKKQRMKMLAARGPSRSHAHHPAAPHTFIPW